MATCSKKFVDEYDLSLGSTVFTLADFHKYKSVSIEYKLEDVVGTGGTLQFGQNDFVGQALNLNATLIKTIATGNSSDNLANYQFDGCEAGIVLTIGSITAGTLSIYVTAKT